MTDLIANELKTRIDAMSFADKTGGLVRTAIQHVETTLEDGQTYKISEMKYPVSSNTTGIQCSTGAYNELSPNERLKSLMYFEQLSSIGVSQDSIKQINASVDMRLVVWLNLKKMGELINANLFEIQAELIKEIGKRAILSVGTSSIGVNIEVKRIVNDPSIFTKYNYDKSVIENMLLYPFTYFAIDFTAKWAFNPSCFTYNQKTEILC